MISRLRPSRIYNPTLRRTTTPTTRPFATMAPTGPHTLPPDRRPLVISGPSGVGKGTLFKKLFAQHPDTFTLSVSHTTRSPREGEAHGVDYHFVPHEEFEALIARDGFVEHAKFGGNRYGTSKMTIEEQSAKGKVVLLDIEMEVCLLLLPLNRGPVSQAGRQASRLCVISC